MNSTANIIKSEFKIKDSNGRKVAIYWGELFIEQGVIQ